MAANDWLCQFLADILQVRVERPANLETTALGPAFLAGLATGVWSALDELPAPGPPIMPSRREWTRKSRDRLLAGWRTAVQRTVG